MTNCQDQIETTLRLFSSENETGVQTVVNQPWTQLAQLSDRFEAVTGWKLTFEPMNRHRAPMNIGQPRPSSGRLIISDMSDKLPAGKSARHRVMCDQLAETLNDLIQTILVERRRLSELEWRLCDVVQIPFDWWQLGGRTGYDRDQLVSWSITTEERVRLFAAGMANECETDAALGGAMLTGVFETLCQMPTRINDVNTILPTILQHSLLSNSRMQWHATVELDPITGEYAIAGQQVERGLCLVDVQSSTVVDLAAGDLQGTLFAGEILIVGIKPQQRSAIREALDPGEPLTVSGCRGILERQLADQPAVLLHRK